MIATVSLRVLVGDLADLLHGMGMDLALDLRDVDHLGGLVGDGLDLLDAGAGGDRARHVALGDRGRDGILPAAGGPGAMMRRTSGRTTNSRTTRPSSTITSCSIQCMMSSLVNCRNDTMPCGSGIGDGRRLGEAQVHHLDLIAALLVEADRERTSAAMRSISSLSRGW